jgi:hypothetical protein
MRPFPNVCSQQSPMCSELTRAKITEVYIFNNNYAKLPRTKVIGSRVGR